MSDDDPPPPPPNSEIGEVAPDLRTMEELCQPTMQGRGGPIAPLTINSTDFGLKHHMIQQVQNSCQFHGLPGDDANKHLDKFLTVTQSMKQNGVTEDGLRLYLFPYSLTHHATAWFDRLPKNSIHTFDEMVTKFLAKYIPPSKVTKLRNDISNFRQLPDESLFEAWERYKLAIDRCPNHNMLLVTIIDTFYNGLTLRHRDTINAAAGGTFMKRTPEECYDLIENMTAHHKFWDSSAERNDSCKSVNPASSEIAALTKKMDDLSTAVLRMHQTNQNINHQVRAVSHSCETCGGPHPYTECPATGGFTQENVYAAHGSYNAGGFNNQGNFNSGHNQGFQNQGNFQRNQGQNNHGNFHNQGNFQNQGNNFQGNNNNQENFQNNRAQNFPNQNQNQNVVQSQSSSDELLKQFMKSQEETNRLLVSQISELKKSLNDRPSGSGVLPSNTIANPRGDVKAITTRSGVSYKGPTAPATPSFLSPEVAEPEPEVTTDTVLPADNGAVPVKNPVPKPSIPYPSHLQDQKLREKASHQLDKFFQIFKELHFDISFTDALLLIPKFASTIKNLLNNKEKLFEMANTPLIENCSAVLLKRLPEKLGDPGKFLIPCIFPGMVECFALADLDLKDEEKAALIKVLKSHKQAIAWKLPDIKSINPDFCTPKILMDDDFKPAVQQQRRVNPKIHEVIKQEVIKLLEAGLIYPISDSPWVSPIHCVPKKGGITVVTNEENELIPTRLVTGWRVCIDYRKLNDATRKDHFPLPFMDQMLERLAGNEYYCFLDGFSGYFQIPIDPQDQEKTTFTCPYGTFAYRRMPFGLCNAPGTFQRCMMAIFHDMIGKTMEVFMDDFSVIGDSFQSCLSHLEKMLKRCEDTNLCLNWEKSHFMVKEGIVLGHKISKSGIEVDRAKVDVIAKLPHPTTVKDGPFIFSPECIEAFQTLKKKLTEAPILVAPDWDMPFELMCDANDFALGAVLGQRKTKHFQPIHYASKTMNEAQTHYTTTEKELLAVVYAFERSNEVIGSYLT
ncbi:hypothetical protein CTI12_AA296900 [Artemisia annua]|uniref:Reverse transcriptase domain-containing protein n=1 Tax=Artemisia annua TaxID=35608 RepID=A0A2U1LNC8_ARTAN|nr:hypothetical protein CTI12_AA296900 [Artemisia annua]